MKYSSSENEYLMQLLKAALRRSETPNAPEGMDYSALIKISKKQQVYSVISEVIHSDELTQEQEKSLEKYVQGELFRTVSMKSEVESIEKELKKNQIKFMPLKGSVIRSFYPKQKMRQMSDVDILYDYTQRDKLLKIMKSHGFRMTASCENSDDFFREPFFTFEWHRELFFEEADFCPHFDLWKNAVQDKDNPYKYHIESTEHFVYTICHMYKHYATNGCGVRFLCDIFVMMNYGTPIDMAAAQKRFTEIGIDEFAKDAIALTNAVFLDGRVTENQQKMLDFMLSNGVYGNMVVDYTKKLTEFGGSKAKYIFRRLFPERKKMFADYRQLEKKPFLLPFYYVIRLFSKARYNSKEAKYELNAIKNIKKDK